MKLRNIFCAILFLVGAFGMGEGAHGVCVAPKKHGLSSSGVLKYPADFKHVDYVNPEAPKKGTLKLRALGTGFDTFFPYTPRGNVAFGVQFLHATLLSPSQDEASSSYGSVAECFEISKDGKSVTFSLRPEAKFHDGTPIRPEDVIFTFEQTKNNSIPLLATYYKDVSGARKTGERAVTFDLAAPDSEELTLTLGQLPVFSKEYYTKHPLQEISLTPPLGSGPYRIGAVDPGRRIVYERVKDWWGENVPIHKGEHNFDKIIVTYYRDDSVSFEGFKAGDSDVHIENIASRWASAYDIPAVKSGKIIRRERPLKQPIAMLGIFLNTQKPELQDRRVRRALAEAFDYAWMNRTFWSGRYKRISSFFTNTVFAAEEKITPAEKAVLGEWASALDPRVLEGTFALPTTTGQGQDRAALAQAQALLKEAGWVLQKGTLIHEKTKKPFKFVLVYNVKGHEKALQAYAQNLKRLGIQAQLIFADTPQFLERLQSFDYDGVVTRITPIFAPGRELLGFWGSADADTPGSSNYARVKNPALDQLLDRLIKAQDFPKRQVLARAVDRFFLSEFYVIPFGYPENTAMAHWHHIQFPDKTPDDGAGIMTAWAA